MNRIILLVFSLIFTNSAVGGELILRENSLGPLSLNNKTMVSLKSLKKLFPQYSFESGIGQGDSADFHYFAAKDIESKTIFSVVSYIENDDDYKKKNVKVDMVEIFSSSVKDEYGLSIGMRYSDIAKKRGTNLVFGANHHDNYLGDQNIWYALASNQIQKKDGPDISPENISLSDIKNANARIVSISWPTHRW